jgi:Zn-dependent protease with chaperone function
VATAAVSVLAVMVAEAVVVAPIAVGLYLRFPPWSAALPFVAWWCVAFLLAAQGSGTSESAREPDDNEQARLSTPWRQVMHRAKLRPDRYQLQVTDRDGLNACVRAGHHLVITAKSARTLPPAQLEAVLAHELGHRLGWRAIPAFVHAHLTWPSRSLWWWLRTLWEPVGPMWKRAVEWNRPIGFLLVFLLAALASAFTVVAAVPSAAGYVARLVIRPLAVHAEFQADAFAVRLGLGPELLAALDHHIESTATDAEFPLRLVRRAERLRRTLAPAVVA